MKTQRSHALEAFARDYGGAHERSRSKLLIKPGESDKAFPVTVLGVLGIGRCLIVSAPTTIEGSLIAVYKGLTLNCQWFNASSAFSFQGVITKVAFEPEPLLYLKLANRTSRREVRTLPRALANLPAAISTPAVITSLLVDLSVTGARVAVLRDVALQRGQQLELSIKPRLIDRDFLLKINCTVVTAAEAAPSNYPDIVFYGLKFDGLPDLDLLVVQAYVQECLVNEMDALAHVLLTAREIVALRE
jgi:hypothetical protein